MRIVQKQMHVVTHLFFGLLTGGLAVFLSASVFSDSVFAADAGTDAVELSVSLPAQATEILFHDSDARQQLVVTAQRNNGLPYDVTRQVQYLVSPAGIVSVDDRGYVVPIANGEAQITIKMNEAAPVVIPVKVTSFDVPRPVSFPNDVIPHLTRSGCNSGACHGTPAGKNNFRLSLLGFEPVGDYEHITVELRGRRVFPAAPEESLLLRKACGDVPHGGGARIAKGSEGYNLIKRWIAEGLHFDPSTEQVLERIEVFPKSRVVSRRSSQQLRVTAFFTDGTVRDITHVADYEANQPMMCEVDENGLMQFQEMTGTTSVMIRFQEKMASFMAIIPLGKPATEFPKSKNFIDRLSFAKLKTLGLPASPVCDDSTFLRRVTLDLTGRLPTVEQTEEFLASTDPDKRAKKIDALLESPGYADQFANKWAGILRNKANGSLAWVARETHAFHSWIWESLNQNKPFDQFATELIAAKGKSATNPAVSWYRVVKDPKDQMADMAQVFLGVRIQCAQCHHHPYEKWSQDDYYGFAAFFSTLGRKEIYKLPEEDSLFHKRVLAQMKNPNNDKVLRPTPLGGEALEIPPERDPRIDLAKWMTSPENPYFAKVLVNRYWKHFFGRGFVEPEDDLRVTNPPTHPELMDQLARSFIDSGFDLKQLCRTICNSSTYQLSSYSNEFNGDDQQNFARFYPRRLSAEVLLDAINDVAGAQNNFNYLPVGVRAVSLPDDAANQESFFLRVFGRPQMDTACECERTTSADLAQSLHLINSDKMQQKLAAPNGRAIRLARDKERTAPEKITEIYLAALSRKPTQNELTVAIKHLERKLKQSEADPKKLSADQAKKEAYEDIIWVVVNTKEFMFNH